KPRFSYDNLPPVDIYNNRVQAAIDHLFAQQQTFLLIDQGRHLEEKSYVYYKDNTLYAFGFVDVMHQAIDPTDLVSAKDRCISNYYMDSLILQYAERLPSKVCLKP